MQPAVFADEERPGDVIVIEPGGRLGLVLETLQGIRIGRLFGGKDFQGHRSAQMGVDGAEDTPHPPPAHVFDQLELPQMVARHHPSFEDATGRVRHGRRRESAGGR